MNESQWRKTPYAQSKAGDPDQAIVSLLEKYDVSIHQISQVKGPNGRPAIVLKFILDGNAYRIAFEVLDAPEVEIRLRVKQVKRAIYWMLKVRLEEAGIFGTAEELMCGWLELPDGTTVYQASAPFIKSLPTPDFIQNVFGLLPSAKKGGEKQ